MIPTNYVIELTETDVRFNNDGNTFLHFKNNSASPVNVIIKSQVENLDPGLKAQDRTIAVAATTEKYIGPFPQKAYNDENGQVVLDISAVSEDTLGGVFSLGT